MRRLLLKILVVAILFSGIFSSYNVSYACMCVFAGQCGPLAGCPPTEKCQHTPTPGLCSCIPEPLCTQCSSTVGGACPCCGGSGLTCQAGVCIDIPQGSCSGSDCGPGNGCSAGFRCDGADVCTVDTTCIPDVANIPYEGPIINNLAQLVGTIFGVFYPAAVLVGVLFIIKAGYMLMTSEGNPMKTKEGQEDLTAAILGTFFVVLSIAILRVIINSIIGPSGI